MYKPWCLESLKKTEMALISTGPHFLGNVNFTVSAEAVESQELCGNEVPVVPEHGRKDTIIKPLLVEVSKPAFSFFFFLMGHNESRKTVVNPVGVPAFG